MTSLRRRLRKIGARVVCHARKVMFQLAEVTVSGALFSCILRAIQRLRAPPVSASICEKNRLYRSVKSGVDKPGVRINHAAGTKNLAQIVPQMPEQRYSMLKRLDQCNGRRSYGREGSLLENVDQVEAF